MVENEQSERFIGRFIDNMLREEQIEEILDREIKDLGNSCRISVPRKHAGKKAKILILKKQGDKKKL